MQEQPVPESPPPVRWSAAQAALIAAAVILAALVGITLLGQAGVLSESAAAALNAGLLGACGLAAGVIGAAQRRRQHWPPATMAYRLAMWCFFLAALHVVKYHIAANSEVRDERIREALEKYQEQQRLKEEDKADTAPRQRP